MKAFIEFGAAKNPNLSSLLSKGYHGIFVEPNPLNIIELVHNLKRIEGSYEIIAGVVGKPSDDLLRTFYFDPVQDPLSECGGLEVKSQNYAWGGKQNSATLEISYVPISLDELMKHSLYPVEHLEIDCEGAEVEIFRHFSFSVKPDSIKVAYHGEESKKILKPIFIKHGYDVREIDDEEHLFAKRRLLSWNLGGK